MRFESEYSIDNPPGTYETRVFIGGSYKFPWPKIIDEIRNAVKECGYQPIILAQFGVPRGQERRWSKLLMSKCGSVILEMTDCRGQYIEFCDAESMNIRMLCIYNEQADITAMVRSSDVFEQHNRCYQDTREFYQIIREFLP